MKVLQLTYRVPYPPTDGGAIGIYNIVKGLKENGCEIDLVAINTPKHSQPIDCMSDLAKQHDIFVNTNLSATKLLRNLVFSDIPYNVERFISVDVVNRLKTLLSSNSYDFIQVEGAFVAYYIDTIRAFTQVPIIIRPHNIEYVIWERLSSNEHNPIKKWFFKHLSKRLKQYESKFYNKADAIAAITQEDAERLRLLKVEKPIQIVPAGIVLDKYKDPSSSESQRNSMFILSALDWLPNLEGLDWFLKEVWPLVLSQNPEATLHIAGKSTPQRISELKIPRVTVHGFVEDAISFKQNYRLMLVPLLSGGGMRVKIIEGLATGKCIISTSVGAEGIDYKENINIVIADTPAEWAHAIDFYLKNDDAFKQIETEALELARKFDNKKVTKKYIDIYKSLADKEQKDTTAKTN